MGVPNMKKFLILVILFLLVGCTKHDTRLLEEEILKAEEDTETEAEAEEIQVIKKRKVYLLHYREYMWQNSR